MNALFCYCSSSATMWWIDSDAFLPFARFCYPSNRKQMRAGSWFVPRGVAPGLLIVPKCGEIPPMGLLAFRMHLRQNAVPKRGSAGWFSLEYCWRHGVVTGTWCGPKQRQLFSLCESRPSTRVNFHPRTTEASDTPSRVVERIKINPER